MLSVVVPLFNEAESIAALYAELAEVARLCSYDMEIVLVDDGSTDGSWAEIRRLSGQDPRVRGIRFRRNFGKAAALSAGFQAARGTEIITLDADLQDDPAEIPKLLAVLGEGYDVVSGWKKVRHDPWHKVLPSRAFNWLVGWLTGVRLHDHNCGLKCYRCEVFSEVRLYGELHRFVPVLAHARGFRVGEAVVRHRPRKYGHSKYGVRRFVKGFLDLLTVKFLTGFSQRPQHLLGAIGLGCLALGGAGMIYLAGYWFLMELRGIDPMLHARPAMIYSLGLLVFGAQLMSIGFLAELIIAYQGRDSDSYSVAERIGEASVPPTVMNQPAASVPPAQGPSASACSSISLPAALPIVQTTDQAPVQAPDDAIRQRHNTPA
jgi:dolichol-phosphate mannosyltransferase